MMSIMRTGGNKVDGSVQMTTYEGEQLRWNIY